MLDLLSHSRAGDRVVHPTVGIVDADPLYRWFVTEALSARGIDGLEFATVADAARFAEGHSAADLLLIDHQTLVDEYASRLPDLRAVAGGSCVLLATPEPGGALPQLGVAAVEKPSGLESLMSLVEGRLPLAS